MLMRGTYTSPESVKKPLVKGKRRQRWFWGYGNDWQICASNLDGAAGAGIVPGAEIGVAWPEATLADVCAIGIERVR
jgi:hypothetical protein